MKKFVMFITVSIVLFVALPAFAHEQVVVVPLNTNKATSPYFPVYDATDVFVGYHFSGSNMSAELWSPENYRAVLTSSTESYTSLPPFYDNSGCTGTEYFSKIPYGEFFHIDAGYVFQKANTSDIMYISKGASPVTVSPAWTGTPGLCSSTSTGGPVYTAQPNDPAITGFQNSYNWPLKAMYTIPPAP